MLLFFWDAQPLLKMIVMPMSSFCLAKGACCSWLLRAVCLWVIFRKSVCFSASLQTVVQVNKSLNGASIDVPDSEITIEDHAVDLMGSQMGEGTFMPEANSR